MKFKGIDKGHATLVAAMVVLLAGCSAGGGGDGTTGTGTGTGTGSGTASITETLSSSTVTSAAPATVSATLHDSKGNPVDGAVVTFTVGAIGSLSSATALTNASGVATVTLSPASATASGADTVVATASVGGVAVTASQGYQLSATNAQIASFTAASGTSSTDKLAAYAQTVLTLNLTGVSSAAPATINITSSCVSAGKATISPATYPATSSTVQFTYKDTGGCGSILSSDTVTATIAGSGASAQLNPPILLTSPTPNSITFSSATPATIYLKGSGYTESSTVKFQVVDTDGNPLPGQQVTLALSTLAGGLLINQGTGSVTETSDANGYVSVIVNSGTVPTPVRVTATLPSGVTTVSSQLSVATGLPSQLHFSLSQATRNIEGMNIDGTPNSYTVRATDRSGNPVPDGTSILYWAEGGQVQATATTSTTAGISSATANFVSQAYRPADGRVTVLAYAIGEESFIDLYGTNVYQGVDATHATADPFQDLGDIVKSRLFDNVYDAAHDETISLSLTGTAAGTSQCVNDTTNYPQFALDQFTPVKPDTCDGKWSGRTYVRMAVETVFSTSGANPVWVSKTGGSTALQSGLDATCRVDTSLYIAPQTIDTTGPHGFYSVAGNPVWYSGVDKTGAALTSGTLSFVVSDENVVRLNPMAAGTTISVTSDSSSTAQMAGGTPVANTTEATAAAVTYALASGKTQSGLTIKFTSPSGLVTAVPVTVMAGARPSACP